MIMDLKLDFDPQEIAEKLHEAIVTAGFKNLFAQAVETECKRLSEKTWSKEHLINSIVQDFIRREIQDILETEYKETIKILIQTKINSENTLEELTTKLVSKIKIDDRY